MSKMSKTISIDDIKKVIEQLEYENEEYGDRIVSLSYAYESAIDSLLELIGESKKYDIDNED